MRGHRPWVRGGALGLIVAACARAPGPPAETAGQVLLDKVEAGSPLARAGLQPGDVLLGARRGARRLVIGGFDDLWELEVEEAPRGDVVLEMERRGERFERALAQDRWRTSARPALPPDALVLHRAAVDASEARRPEEAVAAYERLRDGPVSPPIRAWASVRAAQVRRQGADPHWQRALAAAGEAQDAGLEAWVALQRCQALAEAGAYDHAPPLCEQARAARERLGQPLAAAEAEYRLAVIAGRRGDPREEERRHRALANRLATIAPESLLAVRNLRGLAKSRATQGDHREAFTHARRALALVERRAPRSLDHGASLMILGIFHWFGGEWGPAEARFHEALAIAQAVDPGVEDVANALANLGLVNASRGDLAAADEYYRRAMEAFARSGAQDPLTTSRTLNNLATMANTRGDVESAIRYDREVLALRERMVPGSVDLAVPLLNLGQHLVEAGQPAEAQGYLERALELQQRHTPGSSDVGRVQVTLAEAHRARGDLARAEQLAAEAVALVGRTEPQSVFEAQALRTLAELRAGRGERAEAERLLVRSAALLGTLVPGTLEQARTLHALGRLLRAAGRREAALEPLRGAAAALDRQLATLGGTDEVRARFRESWRHVYRELADLLIELGRQGEAFEVLERSRARAFLLLLRSRAVRLTAGLAPELEKERQAIASAYDDLQETLAERLAAGDRAAVERLSGQRRRLQLRRDQLAERLSRDAPRLAGLEAVADLAAARAALAGQAAALSYFVGGDKTRVAVVGARGEVDIVDLPAGEAELRDLVDRFRFLLEAPVASADPAPLGELLYQRLMAPVEPLLEGAPCLLVIPDGPLHRLPFGALSRAGANGRREWLLERTPIVLAASISAWIELRRARSAGAAGVVAFADPEVTYVPRVVRRVRSGGLPPLPYSRQEATLLAAFFGPSARVLAGSAASEPAARRAGEGTRVLHFATHAFADPVSPLDSALVLAQAVDPSGRRDDGLLHAWEIIQDLRLEADLVTLSACQSGAGLAVADEGLLGLTRAFHFAGARAVLASLWDVSDRSTAALMERFYANWVAGRPKAEALRAAQLALIGSGARTAQWAPFQLYGDGR